MLDIYIKVIVERLYLMITVAFYVFFPLHTAHIKLIYCEKGLVRAKCVFGGRV
jgi:hypothetical protein